MRYGKAAIGIFVAGLCFGAEAQAEVKISKLALTEDYVREEMPPGFQVVIADLEGPVYADANGKTLAYKMGTSNAKDLLKGAKKVPKGTLFFMGANGQLYMRSGPYLEDDGRFKFGPG